MTDAGVYCDIAASCLCGGEFVQAGNLPADGVLEATITSSYVARITNTFGTTTGFATGDVICVNQSAVGATILVPVQNGSDAAQVVPPPPDGGTCVPNFAYTVQLDDAGRPLACNDGIESQLSLTEDQAIAAMRSDNCAASLTALDSRWSDDECAAGSAAGCNESAASPSRIGGILLVLAIALTFVQLRKTYKSTRRR